LVANRKRKRDRLRALGLRQVEARPAQHHESRRALAPVDPRQHPPAQDRAGDEVPPIVLAQPEPVPLHATRQVAARCVEQTALVVAQHFLPRLSHAINPPFRCASSVTGDSLSSPSRSSARSWIVISRTATSIASDLLQKCAASVVSSQHPSWRTWPVNPMPLQSDAAKYARPPSTRIVTSIHSISGSAVLFTENSILSQSINFSLGKKPHYFLPF